ncbi:hypothetical protein F5Y16DRAFT_34997 [Xylariaceae sp. FL0255]|nr:hypothetical protein F5Y16DRAFT_34997 [Xylariaceae sp. FL0255]
MNVLKKTKARIGSHEEDNEQMSRLYSGQPQPQKQQQQPSCRPSAFCILAYMLLTPLYSRPVSFHASNLAGIVTREGSPSESSHKNPKATTDPSSLFFLHTFRVTIALIVGETQTFFDIPSQQGDNGLAPPRHFLCLLVPLSSAAQPNGLVAHPSWDFVALQAKTWCEPAHRPSQMNPSYLIAALQPLAKKHMPIRKPPMFGFN